MIFISYRKEDTTAEVLNLYGRLVDRYGKRLVFLASQDIGAGDVWPDVLQQRLEASSILLAVVGDRWGEARFASGKRMHKLRLEDPEDWVRREICTAIRRNVPVIVVLIDEATLPETEWGCELDQMASRQHARLSSETFERDVEVLCRNIERHSEALGQASREIPGDSDASIPTSDPAIDSAMRRYFEIEERNHRALQLPLASSRPGPLVMVPIGKLRIDLPLIVTHESRPLDPLATLPWIGQDPLDIDALFRESHTSALRVDRAARHDEVHRDCTIGERLAPGSHIVVVGDPGSGKTTLLQWLAHHYASKSLAEPLGGDDLDGLGANLPVFDWAPVMVSCRELVRRSLPNNLEDLLRSVFGTRQFSGADVAGLIRRFESLLDEGRVLLLVDGLDEIPDSEQRLAFSRLLTRIATRFPKSPLVITSRVVGFQAVRDELAAQFDHLMVCPLDRDEKTSFVEQWARLIRWEAPRTAELVRRVCRSRSTAKLSDSVLMLAVIAQIMVFDRELPARRVDIFRRAIRLMIERRRPFPDPPLSVNEIVPHLEFLAYRIRKRGLQRLNESEIVDAFRELRRLEPDEPILGWRSPEELLRACIESIGILNVAGSEVDRFGFEREVIQFFHQSFQEYFAAQAINHERGEARREVSVARLHDLLFPIETTEREILVWSGYRFTETVITHYWQEPIRMAIADLQLEEADEAISMLLPESETSAYEARARAVFALQCLSDEPRVSACVVTAVLDAVMDNLEDGDGVNDTPNTWMDETLVAASESSFGPQVQDHLLRGFAERGGQQRLRIGRCLALVVSREIDAAKSQEDLIEVAESGLGSDQQTERIRAGVFLMETFFNAKGRMGSLPADRQRRLAESLLSVLATDEASANAALWALLWFTNAYGRDEKAGSTSRVMDPDPDLVLLDHRVVAAVEAYLQRENVDAFALRCGCLTLRRERGLRLVIDQRDWIYEAAVVADGDQPRRNVPSHVPPGRQSPNDWMVELLDVGMPAYAGCAVALTLGSFGVYVPSMARPLHYLFSQKGFGNETRDEALVYLALVGTEEAAALLTQAADTPPTEEDDFFYARGLFGLLLLDNVDILAGQIRKNLPHSDVNAYVNGLAGSGDPRGRDVLEGFLTDDRPHIREAAQKALARSWARPS